MTGAHHIQYVFPDLLPSERETIMTGICTDCWNKYIIALDPRDDENELGIEE
jgi:hypothetical protein